MGLRKVILLGILLALGLSACANAPVLRDDKFLKDRSLVTGDPCEAPCWRGITPGETTWRDALTIVEDSTDFMNLERITPDNTEARLVDFSAKDGLRCCRVYSVDGQKVSSILTLLAPQMTFGEVVARYGEPQYFVAEGVTDDQALVSVVFADVPLIVYVFSAGLSEGEISASSEIIGAIYLTAEDMRGVLTSSSLYRWRGYGRLARLADGAFDVTPLPAEATPEATAETN